MEAVPAEPADSFAERCAAAAAAAAAAGRQFDVVYVSTTTYLTQQTLVPSIPAFVRALRAATGGNGSNVSATGGAGTAAAQPAQPRRQAPLVILDGYHGFAALPTDLAEVAGDCCYVAGMLKHAGGCKIVVGWWFVHWADPCFCKNKSEGFHESRITRIECPFGPHFCRLRRQLRVHDAAHSAGRHCSPHADRLSRRPFRVVAQQQRHRLWLPGKAGKPGGVKLGLTKVGNHQAGSCLP